jgi:hypothetical protein
MRRRSVLMVPESECPHPRVSDRRGIRVEDAADHSALVSICHEEPTTATLGKGRQRTPTLSRLAVTFMQADQPKFLTKDELRAAAMRELNVSKLSFDMGWIMAIEDTGRHDWYEPLRRRSRTRN